MTIGIDVTTLVYQGSGVANYTYNLVYNLLIQDKKNEYRLFFSSLRRPKKFNQLDEFKDLGAKIYEYRLPPKIFNFLWGKYHLVPVEWLIGKTDIFFSSDVLRPPLMPGTRGITTIHDLTWKLYPQYHMNSVIAAHENKLAKTLEYKDTIIVDSENTKRDLLRLYPQASENRIQAIYPGVDKKQFRPIKDQDKIKAVLKKYNLASSGEFILYVGAIEPRKHVDRAIRIFSKLIEDPKYAHFKFVLTGQAGWNNEKEYELIKQLGLEERVIFTGYVDAVDLPYLYSAAATTVYLSEYEGFGLPPVESALCNTPVLLYKNSSLAELFKSNYLFAKEGDELSILKQLVSERGEREFTLYLAADFSWSSYVDKFLALCR